MSAQIYEFSPNPEYIPQNIEAEEAILGGILLDPNALERIIDILQPESFYINAHQIIYKTCLTLHKNGQPVDLITVANNLENRGVLATVGGRSRLAVLVQVVSAINIDALAKIVETKATERALIAAGNEIVSLGKGTHEDLQFRLDAAEQKVFALQGRSRDNGKPEMIVDVCTRIFCQIEELAQTGATPAINTGFYDLDSLLGGGFYPQDLIILGGRPSMGKSLVGCNLAYQVAFKYNAPTLIFSLEMDSESITRRYLSNLAGIESDRLRQGQVAEDEWDWLSQAVSTLSLLPIHIDDKACPSIYEIRSKVRKTISKYGQLKLVVIDYLQLMADSSDPRLVQRIGEITRQLKLLARECNVPIVLLSQLNRGVEERSNKRPLQSDLRDSGRIEEDADLILLCYRDEYYNPDTPDRNVMELICTKQRNGPTGTVKLLFEGKYSRLLNLARNSVANK